MQSPTIYIGFRDRQGSQVYRLAERKFTPLPRVNLWHAGEWIAFEWGRHAEDSLNLAGCLLADILLSGDVARELAPLFMQEVVEHLHPIAWLQREDALRLVITEIGQRVRGRLYQPRWRRELDCSVPITGFTVTLS